MFNLTEVIINNCVKRLQAGYRQTFGSFRSEYADILGWAGNMALEVIANSDALYHDVEHTILVTLVGQEVLRGKYLREGSVSCEDWLNLIISWLCHDIGYVKGICRSDSEDDQLYATGLDDMMISLPFGSTDASLAPFHVDRAKLFIDERFGTHSLIDTEAVKRNIELTRFPVPADKKYLETANYPGLVRAADLIGQLADPRYLQKLPALFYEFEETGVNKTFGYSSGGDLRKNYPNFYWNVVSGYIQPALRYLELTVTGKQIIASLYANVFRVEHE
ncbi:metal-dependent phosphohydrolase [Microcoleus sp. FACHB-SPT15]|uniref:Npun_R2479 family HD domain-containing metalloprotein n=1 Tax=Microcoleus sp. FACHB-SPT15 TaxID=2692830 RepID=UPI001783D3D0|nr:Npun_R2479 family HD domain-containing metalloprotein [Microcoleus sp. FACHB-SPT15]MBD1805878.1 metal-dependent phosphohydrolase [Microcoleus sp. FACHB-SPT15]